MLVVDAPDAAQAASTMDDDPFRGPGLVADRSIDEWNVRWGPLA